MMWLLIALALAAGYIAGRAHGVGLMAYYDMQLWRDRCIGAALLPIDTPE